MSEAVSILLIEDNPLDTELTREALAEIASKHDLQVFQDGKEALDYLFGRGEWQNRHKYPLPNLILLDLNMPGMEGHEILKTIKSSPKLKRIPVVILSSSNQSSDRSLSYDYGANSYLVKPISFEAFLEMMIYLERYWLHFNVLADSVEEE